MADARDGCPDCGSIDHHGCADYDVYDADVALDQALERRKEQDTSIEDRDWQAEYGELLVKMADIEAEFFMKLDAAYAERDDFKRGAAIEAAEADRLRADVRELYGVVEELANCDIHYTNWDAMRMKARQVLHSDEVRPYVVTRQQIEEVNGFLEAAERIEPMSWARSSDDNDDYDPPTWDG